MKKFVFEWRHPLGRQECPYAYRWRLDFYYFSFRLHRWIGSDDNRAYHNHPWHFLTIVLKGYYCDVQPWKNSKGEDTQISKLELVKWWAWRNKEHKHWVHIYGHVKPVWTFVTTFGAPRRYAFWDTETLRRKNRDKYFIEEGHMPCD